MHNQARQVPFAPAVRRALSLSAVCLSLAACGTNQIDGIGSSGNVGAGTGTGGAAVGTDGGTPGGFRATCDFSSGDAGTTESGPKKQSTSASIPVFNGIVSAAEPPPPISGGTLLVLRDGVTAVVADSDRDRLYIVNVGDGHNPALRASLALSPKDEPGRMVQDGAGLVHIALRSASALATLDPVAGKITMRRAACVAPRGLAYDASADRLFLACASGDLLTFTPTGSTPERTLKIESDLRDVVVDGTNLLVSRFRSADIIVLDKDGTVLERTRPPAYLHAGVHAGNAFGPAVAWRMVGTPEGGAVMIHQRGLNGTVQDSPGGYGGLSPCDSIVHTSVTRMKKGERPAAGPAMPGFVLPVDLAVSPDGKRVAMVAAGNGHASSGARRLFVSKTDDVTKEWDGGCGMDDIHGPSSVPTCSGGGAATMCPDGFTNCDGKCIDPTITKCLAGSPSGGATGTTTTTGGAGGATGSSTGTGASSSTGSGSTAAGGSSGTKSASGAVTCGIDLPAGVEPVAVGFAGPELVLVQSREPATLWVVGNVDLGLISVVLSNESRGDTGHAVFHSNSGGGLACASCHPEGHEDGRVWDFQCGGRRRTQDVAGGIIGTEPFHWSGDLADFPKLMDTVFVGRMSGPALDRNSAMAALNWINTVPANVPVRSASDAQAQRGKLLFNDATVGCASCHNGKALTNNSTVDVGTSEAFQVPSLRGVSWRAPYMHNGCAPTLRARFGNQFCDGGDAHGKTSQLKPAELDDLVAYLETL